MGEESCHHLRCGGRGARAVLHAGPEGGDRLVPRARRRRRRSTVKYLCLGYYDKARFDGMTESERNAMFDTCLEYDEHLRANGHWAGGEALQGPETALTLSSKNGKVAMTDGPYAETKEQLGGILVLEARDMNHAV